MDDHGKKVIGKIEVQVHELFPLQTTVALKGKGSSIIMGLAAVIEGQCRTSHMPLEVYIHMLFAAASLLQQGERVTVDLGAMEKGRSPHE